MAYLNKYKLLHDNQSGFRPKHSCQTALVKLINDWMKCIDKGDLVGALFIDFRKAFDLVDHSIFWINLHYINLTLLSYSGSNHIYVLDNKGLTDFTTVQSGMPQGSILGPTLFLIFINDLSLHIKKCSSDLYADDSTIHAHGNDIDAIEEGLQGEFGNTKTWGKKNKMNVHMTKTTCILVGARKRVNDSRPLNINADDVNIQSVSKQKLLGVYIDEHLFLVCPYRPLMLPYLI